VSVYDLREERPEVCTGTDEENNDHQKALKVEDG